ncbi:MAG: hypothetical protein U5K74_09400 [Gemmatimonadaceae bacterium]|nr:hypothetical protein [Gemmatimonadaceae bacterium]
MKIQFVSDNYRKRAIEVTFAGRTLDLPYDRLRVRPSAENRIVSVAPDPETGKQAFTYRLRSGEEDTVPLDAVLDANGDAAYLQHLMLHRLTLEVLDALRDSGIGVRSAARRLGTSPTQVYRLLDPAQANKSLGQLLALLAMTDREVEFEVRAKAARKKRGSVSRRAVA